MSTIEAAAIVAAVLAFSIPAAYWQLRRARREDQERDRIIRGANVSVPRVPAASDNWPSADVATQDALELIWSMPEFDPELGAGCDRLWQAIRDEQQNTKGDQ